MNPSSVFLAAGFDLTTDTVVTIIKAGTGGLAVLIAYLSYSLTKDVIQGEANPIKANLAKFSWLCSLVLVVIMVGAEMLRFLYPASTLTKPTLGIQTVGWNKDSFNGPLKILLWDQADSHEWDLDDKPLKFPIGGSDPMMTIHLEQILGRSGKQAEITKQLIGAAAESTTSAVASDDLGPGHQ
jgi:hypothetical protein